MVVYLLTDFTVIFLQVKSDVFVVICCHRISLLMVLLMGLPWWLSFKESACQCRRLEFDPWVGKIPWRRK